MSVLFSIAWASFNEKINYQGKLTDTSSQAVSDGAYDFVFNLYTVGGGGSATWTESWTNAALWTETSITYTNDGCSSGVDKVAYTTGTNESTLAAGQYFWNITKGESAIVQSVDTVNNWVCVYDTPSAWSNGDDATNRIYVKSGLFSVMLGTISSLSSVNFNQTLYLGVTVGADSEMKPRKVLGATPAAFEAKQLGGYTWAIPGTIGSGTPNTGAFTTLTASTSVTTPLLQTSSGALTIQPGASGGADDIIFKPAGSEKMRILETGGDLFFEKGTYDLTVSVTASTGASRALTIPALGADGNVAAYGGSLAAGDLLYGATTNVMGRLTIGSANQVLGVVGAGGSLEYKTISGASSEIDITHGANSITIGIVDPLIVGKGGTGAGTFTQYGVLYGNATSAFGVTGAGSTGQLLIATTSAAPSWGTAGSSHITDNSLDFVDFENTLDLDANLILNQSTYTWTQNFTGTTTTGLTYNANSLSSGTAASIASTSTAGTASGSSYLLNLSRSGANTNTAHTVYGLYATVTNTNATSGTNIAAYLSASGATTANYGLIVENGNVGIGTATPTAKLSIVVGSGSGDDAGLIFSRSGGYGSTTFQQYYTNSGNYPYGTYIKVGTSELLRLEKDVTGGATRAIISADTVGINDTTPDAKFDIDYTSTSTTGANEYASRLTLSDTGVVTSGTDTTYGHYVDVTRTGATGGTIDTYGVYSNVTADNAGAGTSKAVGGYFSAAGADNNYGLIVNAGNVGIGTTAPGAKLEVNGANSDVLTIIRSGIDGTDARLALQEVVNYGMNFEYDGTANIGYIGMANNVAPEGAWSKRIQMSRDGTEVAFMAGNVGIGDASPAALLTVGSGDLFQVNSSGVIAAAAGITSSGTITFSGLTADRPVITTTGGQLTTEAQLALSRGGTAANLTASNGGIVYSTASAFAILAGTATAQKILMSQSSTAPVWSTPTYPNTATSGKVLIGDGTNIVLSTPTFPNASATAGKVIISDGTNWIASTPTYPNASATAGKILRSDGTNFAASTSTFYDTYAVSTILYASSANTITGLATANSGVLVTSSTGVPSILGSMTNGQLVVGSTGATPVLATLTGTASEIDITNAAGSITIGIVDPLIVGKGGTGAGTFTQYGVLYGNATSAFGVTAAGTTGQVLVATTSAAPSWGTVGSSGIADDSLDFTKFEDTLDLDANLILNQTTYTWTQNFTGTTTTGLTYNANSLSSGTAASIASTSTAGTASGNSFLLNLSRSGANASTAHTAYGLYATVTNTNATSGTNIAAYLSASGATTANYGLIVENGYVGIGTVAPGAKLEIKQSSGLEIPFIIDSYGTDKNAYTQYQVGNSSGWEHGMAGSGDSYKYFFSYGAFGAANAKVTIQSDGKVGIGTTGPGYTLEISGDTMQIGSSNANYPDLRINTTNASGLPQISFRESGTQRGNIFYSVSGNYLGITADESDSYIQFKTAGNEVVRIDNAGNVGIGTTSPSQKLEVNYGHLRMNVVSAPGACTAALAGLGAGNVDNGNHYYKIAFVTAYGETGLGTASNVVTVTDKTIDGQVSLTNIPTGAAGTGVTSRKIYRTKAIDSNYYYLATISNNTATTYTDNIADSSMTVDWDNKSNTTGGLIYGGANRMFKVGDGNNNDIAIGYAALPDTTYPGGYNIAIGYSALGDNTTGTVNVAIGVWAMDQNETGDSNVAIGYNALGNSVSGVYNVSIGRNSLFYNLASYNTVVGAYGLFYNTSGAYNFGLGNSAGFHNTSGGYNLAVGASALYRNTTGGYNIGIGTSSLYYLSSGNSYNTAIGYVAGAGYQPATVPTGAIAAGTELNVGTYYYRVSFVLDSVETALSAPTAAITTTTNNQRINLSAIPTYTGPKNCSDRKIYRTKTADSGIDYTKPYYLVATINDNSTPTYADSTTDAGLGAQYDGADKSIALGSYAKFIGSNELVVGDIDYKITDTYWGSGIYGATPSDIAFNASGGSGTNNTGASLIFAGGKATGNAAGGSIIFKTSDVGASGTSAQSLTEKMRINAAGNVGINDTTPDAKFDIDYTSTSTTGANEYASRLTLSDTGVVTSGTDTTYGHYVDVTRTGATGGTIDTYGVYSNVTADNAGAGTSKAVGGYFSAAGADSNYGLIVENGNVGIGVTNPSVKLSVVGQTKLDASNTNQHVTLELVNAGSTRHNQLNYVLATDGPTYKNSLVALKSYGTIASPTSLSPDDTVFSIFGVPYRNGAFRYTSSLDFVTGSTFSDTDYSMAITFWTAATGETSRTERMRIHSNGNVGIGDASPAALLTVGSGDLFQVNSSGVIAAAAGITSSGTITFSGLTADRPVITTTGGQLTTEAQLAVSRGGTGTGTFTANGVLYGNTTSAIQVTAAGTTGQVLLGNTSAAPSWGTAGSSAITNDSLDFVDFDNTLDLDVGLTLNQTTNTWSQSFTGTTTTGLTYNANSLSSGTAASIASTSTAGTASGSSFLLNLSRSGVNTNIAHTAYGLYATVINTNATSGTNIAAYLSASGADTANYGLIVENGNVGIGLNVPITKVHISQTASEDAFRVDDEAGDSSPFIIKYTGDVGIGITGPTHKLHISDDSTTAARAGLYVNQAGATASGTGYGIYVTKAGASAGDNMAGYFVASGSSGTNTAGYFVASGAANTNRGGYFAASGATTNYGLIVSQGLVGIGTSGPQSQVQISGGGLCVGSDTDCNTDNNDAGTVYSSSQHMTVYDVAENYPTKDNTLEAGDIVVTDQDNEVFVKRASATYAPNILGVISTEPGVLLGGFAAKDYLDEIKVPVALSGRIPVKIALSSAEIKVGDFLTSSSEPGKAIKAEEAGYVIGKALENWTPDSGKEKIQVFVNLSWYGGSLNEDGTMVSQESGIENQQAGIIDNLVQKVKKAMASLGLLIENGVAQIKEVVTEKLTAKIARIERIEMIDQRTGDIYCTWVENGEFKKVRGECSTIEFINLGDSALGAEPLPESELSEIQGCTDPDASNYNPQATVTDDTCEYQTKGCTDSEAVNYNPEAKVDDGLCVYENQSRPEPEPAPEPEPLPSVVPAEEGEPESGEEKKEDSDSPFDLLEPNSTVELPSIPENTSPVVDLIE